MKVYVDSIGCRLNQSEIEKIANQIRLNGHEILSSPEGADLVVINTCAVTNQAASDSRQKARQAKRAGVKEIVLTGCWATLEADAARAMPGVRRIFPNPEKDHLVADLLGVETSQLTRYPVRHMLPGSKRRTRAFIKVQDGCDNYCTFCVTRIARGPSRSVPLEQIFEDIDAAIAGGTKEIVLSGVQLGSWGKDLFPKLCLSDLITQILKNTDIPRVRLSSVEPWDLDQRFFDLWQTKRLCTHLHLPLQSGCAETLRRMGRPITPDQYAGVIDKARKASPDMALTTDVIVGFPGETEAEFKQGCDFIESLDFAGGHIFTYSPRPLTPALRLSDNIHPRVSKIRSKYMREIFEQKAIAFRARYVGRCVNVLWEEAERVEGSDSWSLRGMTSNYLRVSAFSQSDLWNQISPVLIESLEKDGVRGRIQE